MNTTSYGNYRSWQEAHAFFCNSPYCKCGDWQPPMYFAILYGLGLIFVDLLSFYDRQRLEEKFLDGMTPLVFALSNNQLRIAKYLRVKKHVSPELHGKEELRPVLRKCEELSFQVLADEEAVKQGSPLPIESAEGAKSVELPTIPGGSKICRQKRQCQRCHGVFSVQMEPCPIPMGAIIECPICVNRRRLPQKTGFHRSQMLI